MVKVPKTFIITLGNSNNKISLSFVDLQAGTAEQQVFGFELVFVLGGPPFNTKSTHEIIILLTTFK